MAPDAYDHIDHEPTDIYAFDLTPGAGVGGCYFPPPDITAHRALAKQSLSSEARYVLDLILNAPAEALHLITTPSHNDITLPRIANYLRKYIGWETKQVSRTLDELRSYVEAL